MAENESSASRPTVDVQELIESSVGVQELIDALNDPNKAHDLIHRHGWTRDELVRRADLAAKRIAAGVSNANVKLKMCL
jgi:hypothetical protein